MKTVIYDTEFYPNCFLAGFHILNSDDTIQQTVIFEISSRKDERAQLLKFLYHYTDMEMVGFNSLAIDYPLIHQIINGKTDPFDLYQFGVSLINSDDLQHRVWRDNRYFPQIDLFKIHHFDNKARTTSLKNLEFVMRMKNISELPFPVGQFLTHDEIDVLRNYLVDDITATHLFYLESKDAINFRRSLVDKYPKSDVMNFSDVKIGKEIFANELQQRGVSCYEYGDFGRKPKQTLRSTVNLSECVPSNVSFRTPHLKEIHEFFKRTVITETKNAFKLTARLGGLDLMFGTGGLHASVENKRYVADDEYMILDMDVTSLYPSIAISYNYYPQHLTPVFVDVYRALRNKRLEHKKGTAENAALKLALNGVYGASNDKFSVFYDPRFTMQITITGQLIVAMLAESLEAVEGLQLIQINTDGITVKVRRKNENEVKSICSMWEFITGMDLEFVEYKQMAIADVNSYIAETVDGKVKRKGRYEYSLEWHQNASVLVVPKVAEQVILHGKSIRETVQNWPDFMDFMLRVKVNKGSQLVVSIFGTDIPMDKTQRYFISRNGGQLVKIMPPLAKNPLEYRRINVNSGFSAFPCNQIVSEQQFRSCVNYDWYINEVEKLVLPLE